MRRNVVIGSGLLFLGVSVVFAPLAVASSRAPVAHQAWTHSGAAPTFVGAPDRLYVAAQLQTETARSFVTFDFEGGGVDLAAAILVVREAAGEGLLSEGAGIAACAMTGALDRDGEIARADAPGESCALRVDLTRGSQGEWKVPLSTFAPAWQSRKTAGIVLLPRLDVTPGTFRVVLDATVTAVEGQPPAPGASSPDATSSLPEDVSPELSSTVFAPSTDAVSGFSPLPSAPPLSPLTPPSPRVPLSPSETGAAPASSRSASTPPVLPFAAALLLCAVAAVAAPTRLRRRLVVPACVRSHRAQGAVGAALLLLMALLPMAGQEVTTFKAGLVLIFLVAAVGLHILVNWAGQLSLAHAGMVGLPAFVSLSLSETHGISPIYLVPVAVVVGVAVGAVVALPTLRAQGLQVALVTLAVGMGIDRYFFTQTWLVGPSGGRAAATPALGPVQFETSRGLYPVLVVFVIAAAVAAWLLMHSKVARAWAWVRSDPAAAAAFGIPVVAHRILAFAVGGAFAGLAGGLSVMWVERLTSLTFPATLSFTYILVAVISGPGYLGGLALAAALIEGGRLFSSSGGTLVAYAGPVALILVVTRYSAGINGTGRSVMERVRESALYARFIERSEAEPEPIGLGFVAGILMVAAGFLAIGLAWYHAGNTDKVWIQNQETLSGGFGGVSLVLTGGVLLIRDRLRRTHVLLARHLERLAPAPEPTDADQPLAIPAEPAPSPTAEPAPVTRTKVRPALTARQRP